MHDRQSLAYPVRHTTPPETSGDPQALRAQGEVRNQIPQQRDDLHYRREQGEDGALELRR